jgi:hypothetical protein
MYQHVFGTCKQGYLSLQAPILLGLLEKVKINAPHFYPQVKKISVTATRNLGGKYSCVLQLEMIPSLSKMFRMHKGP